MELKPPPQGFYRQKQLVAGVVPFSGPTLWRMVKAGTFPQPVKIAPRITAWRAEEVHDWMRSQGA